MIPISIFQMNWLRPQRWLNFKINSILALKRLALVSIWPHPSYSRTLYIHWQTPLRSTRPPTGRPLTLPEFNFTLTLIIALSKLSPQSFWIYQKEWWFITQTNYFLLYCLSCSYVFVVVKLSSNSKSVIDFIIIAFHSKI